MLLEAAVIYPIIILTLIAVIHILIHMYQQTCIQSVVDTTTEKGERYVSGTIITEDSGEELLYYSLERSSSCLREIKSNTEEQIKRYALPLKVEVVLNGNIANPKISVKSDHYYDVPFLYDSKEVKNIAESTYYVHDEAEYIRNIDLILDIGYSAMSDIYKKVKEGANVFKGSEE